MRLYTQPHQYYCGVDIHARSLYTHILDDTGRTVFERDLPASPAAFLDAVTPFRDNLVVGCECMFAWYWLADLCEDERIPFVLAAARPRKDRGDRHVAPESVRTFRARSGSTRSWTHRSATAAPPSTPRGLASDELPRRLHRRRRSRGEAEGGIDEPAAR